MWWSSWKLPHHLFSLPPPLSTSSPLCHAVMPMVNTHFRSSQACWHHYRHLSLPLPLLRDVGIHGLCHVVSIDGRLSTAGISTVGVSTVGISTAGISMVGVSMVGVSMVGYHWWVYQWQAIDSGHINGRLLMVGVSMVGISMVGYQWLTYCISMVGILTAGVSSRHICIRKH